MAKQPKNPNELLLHWQQKAGWSNRELARRVTAEAAFMGEPGITPTPTGVKFWLNGGKPRPPTPEIIAAAFSRFFGYRVDPSELGVVVAPVHGFSGHSLPWEPCRTLDGVDKQTKTDLVLSRRRALNDFTGVAVGAVLLTPLQAGLKATPPDLTGQKAGMSIGMEHVAEIEDTTDSYRRKDARTGSGPRWKGILGHLADAHDLLRDATYSAAVGRRLRVATADLCGVAAWSAFDSGDHDTAQRYWILGLHAAHDADDPVTTGHLLYEMSSQMHHLGRPGDAIELLLMARQSSYRTRSPHLHAQLAMSEASAYAQMGHQARAWELLDLARAAIATPAGEAVPDRLAYIDENYVTGMRGDILRKLAVHQDAETRRVTLATAVDDSMSGLAGIGPHHARVRARCLLFAVDALTLAGEYDEATTMAGRMADALGAVHSTRTREGIVQTRHRLGRAPKDPRAVALVEQLNRSIRAHAA